jgi:hypothetical protein
LLAFCRNCGVLPRSLVILPLAVWAEFALLEDYFASYFCYPYPASDFDAGDLADVAAGVSDKHDCP